MRRLQQWIALLYPLQWQRRYGVEFQALLDQMNVRPGDLLDLLAGAIRMHMTEWSYLKFAAAFSLAGLLAGAILQFVIPEQYVSRAVVGIPSEQQWVRAQHNLFSRHILKTVIEERNLYPAERLREPLEDVIENMRARDLGHKTLSPTEAALTFTYPDRAAAQRTVQSLMLRLESDPGFRTLTAASDPERVSPNRIRTLVMCFGTALLLSIITAAAVHTRWHVTRTFALYGLIGAALLGAGSFLIPARYISHAVMMSTDLKLLHSDLPIDERLAAEIHWGLLGGDNNGRIPMATLIQRFRRNLGTVYRQSSGGTPLLEISYLSDDPQNAQKMVQKLITWETESFAEKASTVEVLENASLPESPAGPNHLLLAGSGLALGLIAGAFRARLRILPQPQPISTLPTG